MTSQELHKLIEEAKNGNIDSQVELGKIYFKGTDDIQIDYNEAAKWFTLAADQDNHLAQEYLGYMYRNGFGVETNITKAVELFKKAANNGFTYSAKTLAYIYRDGEGEIQVDYEKAFHLFEQLANNGDSESMGNVGWAYRYGNGVEANINKAIYWFEKAAAQGSEYAKNNLKK